MGRWGRQSAKTRHRRRRRDRALCCHDNATLCLLAENGGKTLASAGSRARRRIMDKPPLPPQLAPASPTPAQRLERLKVVVKHLSNTWPHVLQRQSCMQSLGRREDVHSALRDTYAAHITNMLQDVLVLDLLREIGALVLDPNSNSASVARAMSALRDPGVIAELRAEYEIVRPLGHIGGDELTPEMRAQIDAHWRETERKDQLAKVEKK